MTRYIIARLLQMLITLFIISLIVFFMVRLKGDPITVMVPPTFSEEQIEALRRAWGFDRRLLEQYVTFLRKALVGDFGDSVLLPFAVWICCISHKVKPNIVAHVETTSTFCLDHIVLVSQDFVSQKHGRHIIQLEAVQAVFSAHIQ